MAKNEIVTIKSIKNKASENLSKNDMTCNQHAYEFAKDSHKEQYRKSGETYVNHPIHVDNILVGLRMDPVTIAGGFLHDVVVDTEVTLADLRDTFNEEVAMVVDGVTKLGKIKYKSKEALQTEYHIKMFIAMAKDIRVIIIKIAYRLQKMRTLKHLPPEKQRSISKETLETFALLAHR